MRTACEHPSTLSDHNTNVSCFCVKAIASATEPKITAKKSTTNTGLPTDWYCGDDDDDDDDAGFVEFKNEKQKKTNKE